VTSAARTRLPDIPKGHSFLSQEFSIDQSKIDAYLAATGDQAVCYRDDGLSPPLAVAALALGRLLEQIELPAGSLHTGQEFEMAEGVPLHSTLSLSGKLAHRSERAGFVVSIVEFEIAVAGEPAMTGRTTVMAPAET
jgi:hypothetical protein